MKGNGLKNIFDINGRKIGDNYPPYVIAELSANHNGNLDRALQTIKAAKECGADAVKLQTYSPDTMTIDCDMEDFQIRNGLWKGYNLYDLYNEAQTPYDWHKPMFDYARKIGITIFSTPFDETAVDLLEDLNVPAYKIASFEAVDLPLIKYVASTHKPMIISTGMASLDEIAEAVEVARESGCEALTLLHCISSYPAPVEQSNLMTIPDMKERFGVNIGLSDHTLGTTVAVASVALGACVIEKHMTLDRSDKGPDSDFSLEPDELRKLCHDAKDAWMSLGSAGYERKPAEEANIKFRRSIYVVKDMKAGDTFTEENIRRIRPGYGMQPKYYEYVLGSKAAYSIQCGEALSEDMIAN